MRRTYVWRICQHKNIAFASFEMITIVLTKEFTHPIGLASATSES